MTGGLAPADAQALLDAMKATSPLMQYEALASPTQRAFHESNDPNKLITTGERGGKTTTCAMELAWLLTGTHPWKENYGPISVLIMCLSRQQAAQVTQKKLFDQSELPGEIGKYPIIGKNEIEEMSTLKAHVRTIYSVRFRNGSVLDFAWSADPLSFVKVQGAQRHLIFIDEARCSMRLLKQLEARVMDARSMAVRGQAPPWLGSILWAATSTEVSDSFDVFKERCLNPDIPGYSHFLLKPGETGAIDQSVIDERASHLTDEEKSVHITGTSSYGSTLQVYGKQWNDERHMLREDHIPTEYANLWLSIDPGVDHPTGIAIVCLEKDCPRLMRVVKCWKHSKQTLSYDVAVIEEWLCGRRLNGIVYDTQLNNRVKHGPTMLTIFKELLAAKLLTPQLGYWQSNKGHDRGVGIKRVMEALDPDPYDKSAPPLIVVNPSRESGGQLLRHEFLKYRTREEGVYSDGAIIKRDDDIVDNIRYLCGQPLCRFYNPNVVCGPAWKQRIVGGPPIDPGVGKPVMLSQHQLLIARSAAAQKLRSKQHGIGRFRSPWKR